MFFLCSCARLLFKFGIHLNRFFAFKKNSPCMYNFGDAMWFANDEESDGKGTM
jgi:hypothetical protein